MNIWLLYFFVQLDFVLVCVLFLRYHPCLLFLGQLKVTNPFTSVSGVLGVTGVSPPCLNFSRVVILNPSESEQGPVASGREVTFPVIFFPRVLGAFSLGDLCMS